MRGLMMMGYLRQCQCASLHDARPQTPPLCACLQVPIAVRVTGGISPATVALPGVGLLLRLSIACYLQLPLDAVYVTGAVSTDPSSSSVVLSPGDPVNTANGICAQALASSGTSSASTGTTTTVSLVAVACAAVGTLAPEPPQFQALLYSLSSNYPAVGEISSATSSIGSSPAPSPPPVALFAAFLSAATSATGQQQGAALSVLPPLVGSPMARASSSLSRTSTPSLALGALQMQSDSSGNSVGMPVAVIAGAAVGGALVLALVAALGYWLSLRRRGASKLTSDTPSTTGVDASDGVAVEFVNRMHHSNTVTTTKGAAAVEAFKAARLAAQRAEQEAQAGAIAIDSKASTPQGTGRKGAASAGRRSVVVKTVFAAQLTNDAWGSDAASALLNVNNPMHDKASSMASQRVSRQPPAADAGEQSLGAVVRAHAVKKPVRAIGSSGLPQATLASLRSVRTTSTSAASSTGARESNG